MDGYPWEVVDFQFVKPGKGTAFTRVRLKNLKAGQALDRTFKTGERMEECDLEEHVGQYMYSDGENYFFMNRKDPISNCPFSGVQVNTASSWTGVVKSIQKAVHDLPEAANFVPQFGHSQRIRNC